MKAIIWKELRENFKWAVLWLLGMGLAMALALSEQRGYWSPSQSICSNACLLVTTIGCALGAGLLGFMQVIMELRRDQWAFLMHRPVSRSTIFAGKVIAGLALYLTASGIPLLMAAWWASTPGRIAAPFDSRMLLPGLADILCGFVFYFAGMLTGLRQARWYASRALGIAPAILCAALVIHLGEFWQALIPIVLIGTVMAITVWGSFLTAGSYSSQPRIAKVTLGLVLLSGIGIAGLFSAGLAGLIMSSRVPISWTRYAIDKDGEILRVTSDYLTIESITDLDGNPLAKYADEKYHYSDAFAQDQLHGVQLHTERGLAKSSYRNSARYFVSLAGGSGALWHYVTSEGRIIGYSIRTKRLVGSLGPEGFAEPGQAHSDRFVGRLRGYYWYGVKTFAFDHRLYDIDLRARTVKELLAVGPEEQISGASLLRGRAASPDEGVSVIGVGTGSGIHLLTAEGEPRFTVDYHYDLGRYPNVTLLMMPEGDRFFVWYKASWKLRLPERLTTPEYVVELASDGSLLKKHELPHLPYPVRSPWYAEATGVVMPVGVLVVVSVHALLSPWLGEFGMHHFFGGMISQGSGVVAFCALTLLSGIVCAALSFYLARRYAFSKRRSNWWIIFSFFSGPVGVLAFLALLEWPALEQCSACGHKRVVDRPLCPRCNAAFPAPALDGTEILET